MNFSSSILYQIYPLVKQNIDKWDRLLLGANWILDDVIDYTY